jgi:predicted transglutaminase-like cysteine proteinase
VRQTIKAIVAAATITATATAVQQVARADFPPQAVNDKELQQSRSDGPVVLRDLTQFKLQGADTFGEPQQSKSGDPVAPWDWTQFKPQGTDAFTESQQSKSDDPVASRDWTQFKPLGTDAFTEPQQPIAFSYSPLKLNSPQVSFLDSARISFLDSPQVSFPDLPQVSFFDNANAADRSTESLQSASLERPVQHEARAPVRDPGLAPEHSASLESSRDTDLPPAGQLGSAISRIQFDAPVLAPMSHTFFCLKYPDDCKADKTASRDGAVTVTAKRWAELVRVNAAVNRAIIPHPNTKGLAGEVWLISPKAGECHDYAVTKRHELLALGWPARDLLLAEVVTSWGEHHLVLVIRTSEGDFIADNLTPNIRTWSQAPYQWVRIQSPDNPVIWSTMVSPTVRARASGQANPS